MNCPLRDLPQRFCWKKRDAKEAGAGGDCRLVRLLRLRFVLQAQRPQAVHIFDRGLVPGLLLLESVLNLRLATHVFLKCRFGYFAVFCSHHAYFSGGMYK
jgi:hypothetical protein